MQQTDVVLADDASDANLELWGPIRNAIAGTPHEYGLRLWQSDGLKLGIWESEVGSYPGSHPNTELCYILSGRMTLTAAGCEPVDVGPGAVVVFPAGWEGTWDVHEPVRKVYVIAPEQP